MSSKNSFAKRCLENLVFVVALLAAVGVVGGLVSGILYLIFEHLSEGWSVFALVLIAILGTTALVTWMMGDSENNV